MPGSRFSGPVGRGHRAGKLDMEKSPGQMGAEVTSVGGYLRVRVGSLAGIGLGKGLAQFPLCQG